MRQSFYLKHSMKTLALVLGLLLSFNGFANTTASLKTVGQAQFNWLVFPVFIAHLKTTDGQYQAYRYPVSLELTYLRSLPSARLLSSTATEWRHQGVNAERQKIWLKQLSNLWPDIKRGDKLRFDVHANRSSAFYYNNQLIGQFQDAVFAQAFLDIWLSPKTSQPQLRRQLLRRSVP